MKYTIIIDDRQRRLIQVGLAVLERHLSEPDVKAAMISEGYEELGIIEEEAALVIGMLDELQKDPNTIHDFTL